MTGTAREPEAAVATTRGVIKRIFGYENTIRVVILVAIISAFGALTKGATFTPDNITNIMIHSTTRGMVALGQFFAILSGGFDLSVGGIALMTSTMGALLIGTERSDGLVLTPFIPVGVVIVLMLLLGLGVGLFNGLLISRVRMPALIVTLGVWQMAKGAAFQFCGGYAISGLPDSAAFIGRGTVAGVPTPVIVLVVVAVLIHFVLNHTIFGRSVYAVGGNPVSALLSGLRVPRIVTSVYAISGLLAGLTGAVVLSRAMSASMNLAVGLELDSIAAVVIGGVGLGGGRGTLIGVVIGVIILGTIDNGMTVYGIDPVIQDLVKGGVIFAAVLSDTLRRR